MNTILNICSIIWFSINTIANTAVPTPPENELIKKLTRTVKIEQLVQAPAVTPKKHIILAAQKVTQEKPRSRQKTRIASQLVQHLSQKAPKLNKKVLKLALTAYKKASAKGAVKNPLLTVIDYSLPSSRQRMWIFDLRKERLLYNTHVAHGMNSGMNVPSHFSNRPASKATSLGTYVTRDTYFGSKGLSLNLQGLERGFNDNAYNRRVVIHGAWYVEPDFIRKVGRAGRSWGCPSIAKTIAKPVINLIKGGSVVFAYYPDKNYLSHSGFIG